MKLLLIATIFVPVMMALGTSTALAASAREYCEAARINAGEGKGYAEGRCMFTKSNEFGKWRCIYGHVMNGKSVGYGDGACLANRFLQGNSNAGRQREPRRPAASNISCHSLWVARNQIYKNNGYCFKTTKAKSYFGNSGCWTSSTKLARSDQTRVSVIVRQERRFGCRR